MNKSSVHIFFRNPSGLSELKKILPDDIVYSIYPYLFNIENYKKNYSFCLVFIPIVIKRNNFKRCTPCKRCKKIKTYSQYCSKCDQELWWEIT